MEREYSEELLELMLAILEAAARAAVVTGRVVSQQALKQTVKPAHWRPRNSTERQSHVEVKGKDGKTIGFVDKNSPLVKEIDHKTVQYGIEKSTGQVEQLSQSEAPSTSETTRGRNNLQQQEKNHDLELSRSKVSELASALVIGGGAFIGVNAAARNLPEGSGMSTGQVLTEAEARAFVADAGWQWVDEQNPLMVEGKPAYVTGPSSIELAGGVDEVIVAEGHLTSPNGFEDVDVKVAGHGTVGDTEVDAWDAEFAAMASEPPRTAAVEPASAPGTTPGPMFDQKAEIIGWS